MVQIKTHCTKKKLLYNTLNMNFIFEILLEGFAILIWDIILVPIICVLATPVILIMSIFGKKQLYTKYL